MNITTGKHAGRGAKVFTDWRGRDIIDAPEKNIILSDGDARAVLIMREESRGFLTMVCILILSITVVGLIIGIPWLIVSKRLRAVVSIIPVADPQFNCVVTDKSEFKILSKYMAA